MHHRKLNLHKPILASSRSKTSVLTIAGVMSEVPDGVISLSLLTSLVYFSKEMGWDLSVSERVRSTSSLRYILVQISRCRISAACPSRILLT